MAELSHTQTSALRDLKEGPLSYSVAGWTRPGCLGGYATPTVESLAKRGLCKAVGDGKRRLWRITAKGINAAERLHGPPLEERGTDQ